MTLRASDSDLFSGGQVGDWCFLQNDSYIAIRLPGGSDEDPNLAAIRIRPYAEGEDRAGSGAVWEWDGNHEAPTLSPSILHHSDPPWHGFLRAGKLVEA